MNESNPAQSAAGSDIHHSQWGLHLHETCQYNFFCDDKFFCVRQIELRDFRHQSAWLYDGKVLEVLNLSDKIERIGDTHLKTETPRFLMESDDSHGSVTAMDESGKPGFEMRWTIPISSSWGTPDEGDGMHQPLLRGEVTYQGQTYSGPGYCKRAWFDKDAECYAWRFIEGAFDDGNAMVWTADAFFGLNSYDYFKIAQADGTILVADNEHTHHRDNIGYGSIDGRPFEAEVEEIGQWETRLLGGTLEALLRQRYSRLTVRYDGEEHKGYALHEMGGGMMR